MTLRTPIRLAGAAGILLATAVLGGTLISVVAASAADERADAVPLGHAAAGGAYCETFLDAFAAELGVERAAIGPAAAAAATAAIEAAVAAGDLDAERGEALAQRIAEHEGDGCGLLGARAWHGGGRPLHHPGIARHGLEAAAESLGMERRELLDALRGSDLRTVAAERGVAYEAVTAAVLASVRADLDAAVADERISREQADAAIERITAWLDEGGDLPRLGGHEGRHGG